MIGTNGTHGVRKGRSRSGRVRRSTSTPMQTSTKASSVPMFTSWPSSSQRQHAGGDRHRDAGEDGGEVRRAELRVHRAPPTCRAGRRATSSRRPATARGASPGSPSRGRARRRRPRAPGSNSGAPIRCIARAIGAATLRSLYGTIPTSTRRDQHVEHGADRQRAQDADRHVPLRVLGLLRRGRDGVEADVREEDQAGAAQDARDAVGAPLAGVGRDERRELAGWKCARPTKKISRTIDDLQDHDEVVDRGRFLDADHQDGGHHGHDEHRGQR